jgi:hypothetical protein
MFVEQLVGCCWNERSDAVECAADALSRENAHLKARLAEVEAALAEAQKANRRLEDILRSSQRERFGSAPRSCRPTSSTDRWRMPSWPRACSRPRRRRPRPRCKGRAGRRPASRRATGCGEVARIGEDVSERLDVIPAQFQVLVTRRPRYACRRCSQAVAQAHAPEHVVPGGSDRAADRLDHRLEVRRSPSIPPPGRDLQSAGDPPRSRHARQLGRGGPAST